MLWKAKLPDDDDNVAFGQTVQCATEEHGVPAKCDCGSSCDIVQRTWLE